MAGPVSSRTGADAVGDRPARPAEPARATNRLRWLGHSTVVIELDGLRLLTDPLLRKRVFHLRRAAALPFGDLGDIDAVLISHAHYDHLDLPSLSMVHRETTVCVPLGLGGLIRRLGFASVVELTAGQDVSFGRVTVHAVRAEHPSRRVFGSKSEALGYVVEGERAIYFTGDTGLFRGMAQVASPDVALLPIWGWGPFLGPDHLDPQRAAQALALIRPRMAIPVHWGTYYVPGLVRSRPASLRAPAHAFVHAAAAKAPGVKVRILPVGGALSLDHCLGR
jgi:L-ascorbate metabolism protein UlaG (beta-lactamase superfamily)